VEARLKVDVEHTVDEVQVVGTLKLDRVRHLRDAAVLIRDFDGVRHDRLAVLVARIEVSGHLLDVANDPVVLELGLCERLTAPRTGDGVLTDTLGFLTLADRLPVLLLVLLALPLAALALRAEEGGEVLDEHEVTAVQQQVDLLLEFGGGVRDADVHRVVVLFVLHHALVAPHVDTAVVHALEVAQLLRVILQIERLVGGDHAEVPAGHLAVDRLPVLRTSLTVAPPAAPRIQAKPAAPVKNPGFGKLGLNLLSLFKPKSSGPSTGKG